jgi:hypothetical protein
MKTGDRVRLIATEDAGGHAQLTESDKTAGFRTGQEYVVSRNEEDINIIYVSRAEDSDWAFFPEQLELIEEG